MAKDVRQYFENTVIPLIEQLFPEVAAEMSIQILGSYGLGLADEHSDLDSLIWLEDDLWRAKGGQVQLLLETELRPFATHSDHCQICVWPVSWLGERRGFLESNSHPPWEKVPMEQLFELQHNLVLRDPHGLFRRLRDATRPERFPDWLWQKRIMDGLNDSYFNTLVEYRQCARRNETVAASILLGRMVTDLLRLGFLINRAYYPWHTRLRWAFEKLPPPADKVLGNIDRAVSSGQPTEALEEVEAVLDMYVQHIAANDILPAMNLSSSDLPLTRELEWAQRCKAWSNPQWRTWVKACQDKADKAGHPDYWWIWSLWGWK